MAWGYWSATAVDRGRSPRKNTQCAQMPISCPQADPPPPPVPVCNNSPCHSPCQQSPCHTPQFDRPESRCTYSHSRRQSLDSPQVEFLKYYSIWPLFLYKYYHHQIYRSSINAPLTVRPLFSPYIDGQAMKRLCIT